MKKIKTISLNRMTLDECFQFHTVVYGYYKECDFLNVSAFEANYKDAIANLDIALKQVRESDKTVLVTASDLVRDHLYDGLSKTNEVALLHFDDEVASAAHSIDIVLRNYGNPTKLPYPAETSSIYNLCQEFQSATYAPLIAEVGLTEWVVRLKKSNEDFDKLYNDRSNEQSVLIAGLAKDARLEVENCYRILIAVTEVELLIADCPLHAYVAKLNEHISTYKKIIAARTTRNNRKKKNDQDGNNPIEIKDKSNKEENINKKNTDGEQPEES